MKCGYDRCVLRDHHNNCISITAAGQETKCSHYKYLSLKEEFKIAQELVEKDKTRDRLDREELELQEIAKHNFNNAMMGLDV